MNRSEELTKEQFLAILNEQDLEFFRKLKRITGDLEFLGAWRT